jgi:hypothetical protein
LLTLRELRPGWLPLLRELALPLRLSVLRRKLTWLIQGFPFQLSRNGRLIRLGHR